MLKRCYYISNSYDGAYFVLTDNIENYIQKMASYVINLEGSKKTNHYSFGSIELTDSEYQKHSTEARRLESSLTQKKMNAESTVSSDVPAAKSTVKEDEQKPVQKKETIRKSHLTLLN